ncbi:hypothetical protein [Saccharibacter floricola]|uniref:Uncharacterized protein n=1 Tax=Saccharibacter floricola DSM 15669 TaxID=1123227 RepID=A0ABQ0NZQ8_9PROT|nr:hypothetical protein [Saccharibacter floricola]GBQ07252.1 hypothetical protein AA15669_1298 [Saccharibacter floricola DSM 15669]
MTSLLLDADSWDIGLDDTGNLAVASDAQSILQDACSAEQTWLGEVLYDQSLGVSYDDALLAGKSTSPFYAADVEQAVQAVPGVAAVTCHLLTPTSERRQTGILVITATNGRTAYVAF